MFFFNAPPPTEISTSFPTRRSSDLPTTVAQADLDPAPLAGHPGEGVARVDQEVQHDLMRSEEHTSELQSLTNLVCRLLLEKKNAHVDRQPRADAPPLRIPDRPTAPP